MHPIQALMDDDVVEYEKLLKEKNKIEKRLDKIKIQIEEKEKILEAKGLDPIQFSMWI